MAIDGLLIACRHRLHQEQEQRHRNGQNGAFRPVCRSCDFYTSIYHKSLSYDGAALQSLAEFKAALP